MFIKAAILDGDEGLQEFLGEGFKRQDFASLAGQLGEIGAVPCPHTRRLCGFQAIAGKVGQARQGTGEVGIETDSHQHDDPDEAHRRKCIEFEQPKPESSVRGIDDFDAVWPWQIESPTHGPNLAA